MLKRKASAKNVIARKPKQSVNW